MEYHAQSALLVMDMQAGILKNYPDSRSLLTNAARAITAARSKGILVIYVVVGFRPHMPEISNNSKAFIALKERMANGNMNEFMEIDRAISPLPHETVIIKKRFSAFTGSDLEVVLRANHIQQLVLMGVSTSGVVLSTLREAADKDYRITVLSDACIDGDSEVHRVLTTKVFPRQAEVMTVEEWMKE